MTSPSVAKHCNLSEKFACIWKDSNVFSFPNQPSQDENQSQCEHFHFQPNKKRHFLSLKNWWQLCRFFTVRHNYIISGVLLEKLKNPCKS